MLETLVVSVRGYNRHPVLLLVDLKQMSLLEVYEFDFPDLDHVPDSKIGFSGLAVQASGQVIAALWDRLVVIDMNNGSVVDQISDPRFSDLHSIYVDEFGRIWVANTNLDGVYIIDEGRVEPFWHTWECGRLGRKLKYVEEDYRKKTKEQIEYHSYHINGVFASGEDVICSFLGSKRPRGFLERKIRQLAPGFGFGNTYAGGYFVVAYGSRELKKVLTCEGIHDTKELVPGWIYSTQYFGRTIIKLNLKSMSMESVKLQLEAPERSGLLTRGIVQDGETLWIGHTTVRGWTSETSAARIRQYDSTGGWTGREIEIPRFVGIYDMAAYSEGRAMGR